MTQNKPPIKPHQDVALPKYRSHKIVEACVIEAFGYPEETSLQDMTGLSPVTLYPKEQEIPAFTVPYNYILKHAPEPGGVFVRYEDGYVSYSPFPQFDKGNRRIDEEGEGCLCQGCGCHYDTNLLVPDDVWEKIKPQGMPEGGGLLCPNCVMGRAVKQGLWTAGLAFDVLNKSSRYGKELSAYATSRPHAWRGSTEGHPLGFSKNDPIGVAFHNGLTAVAEVGGIDWTVGTEPHHVRVWWYLGPIEEDTPASYWREEGLEDPHGDDYDCPRSKLLMGELTDDQMANRLFLHDHRSGLGSIAMLQAGKDRIRWLSRAYEREKASNRESARQWRNDAFEKAAEIVERHLGEEGKYIKSDILALIDQRDDV